MIRILRGGIVSFGCVAAIAAPVCAASEWGTDLPAALQQAEREGKLVLVDFTGSDWCSACIVLRRSVLDNASFREFAADKFVLMEVDLPLKEGLTPELRRRNEEIAKRYGVGGFPTVMVLDPQGRVMGGFQGGGMSLPEVQQVLEKACDASVLFRRAAGQEGEAKARTLYEVYRNFPEGKSFASARDALQAEILMADEQNVTGIHGVAAVGAQARRFEEQRASLPAGSAEMGRLLETQLAEALPANRAEVMMARCQYALATAETVEDVLATRRMFEELLPLLPEAEARELLHFLNTYFRDPSALLQMLKANRPKR